MLIKTALINYLLAQTGITDLVGTRIYFVIAPQDVAKPYIILTKVDSPRLHSHDGYSHLASPRFQVSIFSTRYGEGKGIAAAVQAILQGYAGTMGGAGGVDIFSCVYEDENDFYEEGTSLYQVACDYTLWHRE